MNVYDFDGTLYRGDSTHDFLVWCARRYPRVIATLPRTGLAAVACLGIHAIDKTRFKGALYRFLPHVPDIEREVARFWREREHAIVPMAQPDTPNAAGQPIAVNTAGAVGQPNATNDVDTESRTNGAGWADAASQPDTTDNANRTDGKPAPRPGDLVISAGPEFLLHDVCDAHGLELIASQVDPHTGRVLGPNCSNAEKVARFRAAYPEEPIDRFYSDSLNDAPLAALAREAWLVNLDTDIYRPWPFS